MEQIVWILVVLISCIIFLNIWLFNNILFYMDWAEVYTTNVNHVS